MPISASHPRLWQNGRLAYLQAQADANSPYYVRFQATPLSSKMLWWRVVDWASETNAGEKATKRTAMLAEVDEMIASTGKYQPHLLFQSNGLTIGDFCKDAAFAYDWAYDELSAAQKTGLEDAMMAMVFIVYNAASDPWAEDIYRNQGQQTLVTWGRDTPQRNYYPAMLKGAVYAWLATYGAQPTTLNFPFGSATDRQTFFMRYPQDGTTTTDLGAWLAWKLSEQMLPDLDEYIGGGANHEGNAYGSGSFRNYFEILRVIKDAGGTDYAAGKSWWAERIMFNIFNALPNQTSFELGDKDSSANGASARISTMLAVDELRVNDSANPAMKYGQYWLDSGYSLSEESNPRWSYGHDFFLWNGTVTGVDYKGIIDPWWYAYGAGVYISRRDFSATDDAVMFSAKYATEEHTDHDGCQVQVWRSGSGDALDVGGFLLCDEKTGGTGSVDTGMWATTAHCSHTFGAGGKVSNGITPPALGWNQRNGETCTNTTSILRQCGNARFSYVQMEANNAYRMGATNNWSNPKCDTSKYPPINDIFMREGIHFRKLGVVVVYDRGRTVGVYADPVQPGKDMSFFHYPKVEPTDVGGGIRRVTNGENRMFRKHILPTNLQASASLFIVDPIQSPSAASLHTWSERITVPQTYSPNPDRQYSKILSMFEFGDKDTLTAMTDTTAIDGGAAYDLDGVTIKHAQGYHHVLFSSKQDGSTGSNLSFIVTRSNALDRFVVCDLNPSTFYNVEQTLISGSTYLYSLSGTGGVSVQSNSAGVVEFTSGQVTPSTGAVGDKKIFPEGN